MLAQEYVEAFEFRKAITAYQTAIALETHVQEAGKQETGAPPDKSLQAHLLFNLGWACYKNRSFENALVAYRLSNELQAKLPVSYTGNTYHQIGMVYAEQRQWAAALENYAQALKWYEQTGNSFELGGTYHQIGMAHEGQSGLSEAKEWFEKSLLTLREHNHPGQSIAEASLARIEEKLQQPE